MIRDTSVKAYNHDVVPTISERQKAVLEALRVKEQATNNELAHYLDWPINTVTPRIFELRKSGLVQEAGKRSCKITGKTAYVWQTIPKQKTLDLEEEVDDDLSPCCSAYMNPDTGLCSACKEYTR